MAVPSEPENPVSASEIDAISSRRFSTSFRGWNPDEVRVHLVEVAELVRSLTHRQAELERLLAEAEAAARRADLTRLDPDEVARILGEETARVLRTARDSAEEIEAKATAQAELLTRQAADDAAAARAQATEEAARITSEARETASATRAAGEAHLEDVRAAGEAQLAEQRRQMEDEIAAERQAARDEGAALLAEAQDQAAEIRRAAEDDAARTLGEAQEYAATQRAEVDDELAQRRAVTEQEVEIMVSAAERQVAEAELLRDRILADLARKRRAARQHLEQLHAGRDRLLTAYEVIRVTTEQATDELGVVLGDAKRVADDAARRVGGEPLPSPEAMLAELELARSADLPILTPAGTDDDRGGAEVDTDGDPGLDTGTVDDAGVAPAEDAATGDADDAPATAETATTPGPTDAPAGATDGADPHEAAVARGNAVPGPDVAPASVPMDPPAIVASRDTPRRPGRRGKHRHDPLAGEKLPDVPMRPVDASAEFESVRVVAVGGDPVGEAATAAETDSAPAPAAEQPSTAPAPAEAKVSAEKPVDRPTGEKPEAPAPKKSPSGGSTTSEPAPTGAKQATSVAAPAAAATTAAPGLAETQPTKSKPTEPGRAGTDAPAKAGTGAAAVADDDPASSIFARLRAERAGEAEAPSDDPPAKASPTGAKPGAATSEQAPPKADAKKTAAAKTPTKTPPAARTKPAAAAGAAKEPVPAKTGSPAKAPAAAPAKAAPAKSSTPTAPASPATRSADTPAKTPAKAKTAAKVPASAPGAGRGYDPERLVSLFERRDAAVDEVARRLAKHLKRQLSDQQSGLLDDLRRRRGVTTADEVLGAPDTFAGAWGEVIRADLVGAVASGVALAGDLRSDATAGRAVDLDGPTTELIATIADPLRSRLARALGEGMAGDAEEGADADDPELAERIRACYREWRGARLTASVADACARAFGLGVRAAVPATVGFSWFCGPGDEPCSDCNDNELGGVVADGAAFPTGQVVAPAHPGCRCLALPAAD